MKDYTTQVYVVNVPADAVLKYSFERIWVQPDRENGIPGYRYTEAHEIAPEAAVSDLVSLFYRAMNAPPISITNGPRGLPDSVFTDITNSALHHNLQVHLRHNIHWSQDLVESLFALLQSATFSQFDTSGLSLEITFRYADGSIAEYRYDKATDKWERIPGTEMDSEGNFVPSRVEDFSSPNGGRRDFNFNTNTSNGNLLNFFEMARIHGVPVTSQTSGGRVRIVCVKVGGGAWDCARI